MKNGQLVITNDGLGTVKIHNNMIKKDGKGNILDPVGLNVFVGNLPYKESTYKPKDLYVVDIIDDKTAMSYPLVESDYLLALLDDAPIEFVLTRTNKAIFSSRTRKKLAICKTFTRSQNGIKLFKNLTTQKIWSPIIK